MSPRVVCAAAVLLIGRIASASAGEPVKAVSQATLATMGFESVQPMSDREGLDVHGKGSYVIVWGSGYGPIVRQHFARGSSHMVSGPFVSGGSPWGVAR